MVVRLGPDFTVDGLVSSINVQAVLPSTSTLFTTANIITILDEEMRGTVMSLVKALKEEFWVTNYDAPIVANQTAYAIPYRAMGAALRDCVLVDANGNELKLVRYEPEDIKFPSMGFGSPFFPLGFYLKDNSVVLFPPTAANYTTYTLRMKYERRPSNLLTSASCGQVTASSSGASTLTLTVVPSTWAANLTTVDVINNLPPFNSVADDVTITNIAGLTVTVSSFPTGVANGYWVAPSMQTPVPQIPYEAFPILSQLGVQQCMTALGDVQGIKAANDELAELILRFNSLMTPRVAGTPKILSGQNNILNAGRGGGWNGR